MENAEFKEALRELMHQYDYHRKLWIEKFSTDKGYDKWFSQQIDKTGA
jgi:hypothetical protein